MSASPGSHTSTVKKASEATHRRFVLLAHGGPRGLCTSMIKEQFYSRGCHHTELCPESTLQKIKSSSTIFIIYEVQLQHNIASLSISSLMQHLSSTAAILTLCCSGEAGGRFWMSPAVDKKLFQGKECRHPETQNRPQMRSQRVLSQRQSP